MDEYDEDYRPNVHEQLRELREENRTLRAELAQAREQLEAERAMRIGADGDVAMLRKAVDAYKKDNVDAAMATVKELAHTLHREFEDRFDPIMTKEWRERALRAERELAQARELPVSSVRREIREAALEQGRAEGAAPEVGLPGFTNHPNVPIVTLTTGAWASATVDQILEDLRMLAQSVVTRTKQVRAPNTMLMPTELYGILQKPCGSQYGDTIMSVFLRSNPYIKAEWVESLLTQRSPAPAAEPEVPTVTEAMVRAYDKAWQDYCRGNVLKADDGIRVALKAALLASPAAQRSPAPAAEPNPKTVRSMARARKPLDGADAQALEGALQLTEKERDDLREKLAQAERERDLAIEEIRSQCERANRNGAELLTVRHKVKAAREEIAKLREEKAAHWSGAWMARAERAEQRLKALRSAASDAHTYAELAELCKAVEGANQHANTARNILETALAAMEQPAEAPAYGESVCGEQYSSQAQRAESAERDLKAAWEELSKTRDSLMESQATAARECGARERAEGQLAKLRKAAECWRDIVNEDKGEEQDEWTDGNRVGLENCAREVLMALAATEQPAEAPKYRTTTEQLGGIKLTTIHLTDEQKAALCTNGARLPAAEAPPDLTVEHVQAALKRAAAGSNELLRQTQSTFRAPDKDLRMGAAEEDWRAKYYDSEPADEPAGPRFDGYAAKLPAAEAPKSITLAERGAQLDAATARDLAAANIELGPKAEPQPELAERVARVERALLDTLQTIVMLDVDCDEATKRFRMTLDFLDGKADELAAQREGYARAESQRGPRQAVLVSEKLAPKPAEPEVKPSALEAINARLDRHEKALRALCMGPLLERGAQLGPKADPQPELGERVGRYADALYMVLCDAGVVDKCQGPYIDALIEAMKAFDGKAGGL